MTHANVAGRFVTCAFSLSRHEELPAILDHVFDGVLDREFVLKTEPRRALIGELVGVPDLPLDSRAVVRRLTRGTGRSLSVFELVLKSPTWQSGLVFSVPPIVAERNGFVRPTGVDAGLIKEVQRGVWDGGRLRVGGLVIPLDSRTTRPLALRIGWLGEASRLDLTAEVPCDSKLDGVYTRYDLGGPICFLTLARFERVP